VTKSVTERSRWSLIVVVTFPVLETRLKKTKKDVNGRPTKLISDKKFPSNICFSSSRWNSPSWQDLSIGFVRWLCSIFKWPPTNKSDCFIIKSILVILFCSIFQPFWWCYSFVEKNGCKTKILLKHNFLKRQVRFISPILAWHYFVTHIDCHTWQTRQSVWDTHVQYCEKTLIRPMSMGHTLFILCPYYIQANT